MMTWIKKHLSTFLLIFLILAFALIGFQLRKTEDVESDQCEGKDEEDEKEG